MFFITPLPHDLHQGQVGPVHRPAGRVHDLLDIGLLQDIVGPRAADMAEHLHKMLLFNDAHLDHLQFLQIAGERLTNGLPDLLRCLAVDIEMPVIRKVEIAAFIHGDPGPAQIPLQIGDIRGIDGPARGLALGQADVQEIARINFFVYSRGESGCQLCRWA